MSKILLVEDEKLLREMYANKFKKEGIEVLKAKDANEAFSILKTITPDLVLLDVLMPRESGIEALKRIKEVYKNLKVVVFSNLDDPNAKKKVKALKGEDYLIKTNFTPQELIKKIKTYL